MFFHFLLQVDSLESRLWDDFPAESFPAGAGSLDPHVRGRGGSRTGQRYKLSWGQQGLVRCMGCAEAGMALPAKLSHIGLRGLSSRALYPPVTGCRNTGRAWALTRQLLSSAEGNSPRGLPAGVFPAAGEPDFPPDEGSWCTDQHPLWPPRGLQSPFPAICCFPPFLGSKMKCSQASALAFPSAFGLLLISVSSGSHLPRKSLLYLFFLDTCVCVCVCVVCVCVCVCVCVPAEV